jgi:hypothetical protein
MTKIRRTLHSVLLGATIASIAVVCIGWADPVTALGAAALALTLMIGVACGNMLLALLPSLVLGFVCGIATLMAGGGGATSPRESIVMAELTTMAFALLAGGGYMKDKTGQSVKRILRFLLLGISLPPSLEPSPVPPQVAPLPVRAD